jgi:hypothetical protein
MKRRHLHLVVNNTQKTFLWECPECYLCGTVTVVEPDSVEQALSRFAEHHKKKHPDCNAGLLVLPGFEQGYGTL